MLTRLIVVIISQYMQIKSLGYIYLKFLHFAVCQLYFNKTGGKG